MLGDDLTVTESVEGIAKGEEEDSDDLSTALSLTCQ